MDKPLHKIYFFYADFLNVYYKNVLLPLFCFIVCALNPISKKCIKSIINFVLLITIK